MKLSTYDSFTITLNLIGKVKYYQLLSCSYMLVSLQPSNQSSKSNLSCLVSLYDINIMINCIILCAYANRRRHATFLRMPSDIVTSQQLSPLPVWPVEWTVNFSQRMIWTTHSLGPSRGCPLQRNQDPLLSENHFSNLWLFHLGSCPYPHIGLKEKLIYKCAPLVFVIHRVW